VTKCLACSINTVQGCMLEALLGRTLLDRTRSCSVITQHGLRTAHLCIICKACAMLTANSFCHSCGEGFQVNYTRSISHVARANQQYVDTCTLIRAQGAQSPHAADMVLSHESIIQLPARLPVLHTGQLSYTTAMLVAPASAHHSFLSCPWC
jgi:hypothetical protein